MQEKIQLIIGIIKQKMKQEDDDICPFFANTSRIHLFRFSHSLSFSCLFSGWEIFLMSFFRKYSVAVRLGFLGISYGSWYENFLEVIFREIGWVFKKIWSTFFPNTTTVGRFKLCHGLNNIFGWHARLKIQVICRHHLWRIRLKILKLFTILQSCLLLIQLHFFLNSKSHSQTRHVYTY